MTRLICPALLLAVASIYLPTASAQIAASAPSVSGSGTSTIERPCETLRMEVDLLAKGKELKDALSKLKQRRKAAEEQLAKLGAEPKSIRWGSPQISSGGDNDQQRQMQIMMRQRMMQRRGARRAAEKPAVAPPVTVAMSLVAQWPLKTGDAEQLLIAAHDLEEKIKAADLAGRKAAEELSPEEQELAEENEEDSEQVFYQGQQQPKPGEPRFVYVVNVSEDDRNKAFAEAFDRAKASATRLAKAAHAELGDLQQLAEAGESGADPEGYEAWGGYEYQMFQRAQRHATREAIEAIGPRPGVLKYHVSLTASFALK
ncbi:MAG TPA: hypothetical protein VJ783_22490 [Pirellulales bacterium]|nr:hypothetical protein [Pirellulales bacterium]